MVSGLQNDINIDDRLKTKVLIEIEILEQGKLYLRIGRLKMRLFVYDQIITSLTVF